MKDKVLKLCRRLKKSSLNELSELLEIEDDEIKPILWELEQEELIVEVDGIISMNDKRKKDQLANRNLKLMFNYQTPETIDLIIKGFCLNIPPQKICYMVNVGKTCLCNYYAVFRKMIYERQFKELLSSYRITPQMGKYRKFFEKYAYFYVYKNKVFVSEKLFNLSYETNFKMDEMREFKRMYCYLARSVSHHNNEVHIFHILAEYIWRNNKSFDYLYKDLKENLIA